MRKLFEKHGVQIYSETDITGHTLTTLERYGWRPSTDVPVYSSLCFADHSEGAGRGDHGRDIPAVQGRRFGSPDKGVSGRCGTHDLASAACLARAQRGGPPAEQTEENKMTRTRAAVLVLLVSFCAWSPVLPGWAQKQTGGADSAVAAAPAETAFLKNVRQLVLQGSRSGEGYFSQDGKNLIFQSEREAGQPLLSDLYPRSRNAETAIACRRGKGRPRARSSGRGRMRCSSRPRISTRRARRCRRRRSSSGRAGRNAATRGTTTSTSTSSPASGTARR